MPFYSDTETYYENMRALFACVRTNYPRATEAIANARINIRVRTTAPDANIIIHGRARPVTITYGENGARPDLEIDLTADTFHKILLGEFGLRQTLSGGKMKIKGPIWKAMSLGELFKVTRQCYPDILRNRS